MIELYDFELSTDAYKVRLLLTLLGLSWETRPVEFYPLREHRAEWFLQVNPRGELPVVVVDGEVIEDAQAILMHIARNYDPAGTWFPEREPAMIGQVSMWMSFADALTQTAGAARLHDGFLYDHIDVAVCRSEARDLLRALDEHLWFAEQAGRSWICTSSQPTVADIACFPDIMLCEEGRIPMLEYQAVRRWTDRIKRLPGFVPMPGMFPI